MGGPGQSVISIVDADPDLADLLDARELERARHEALTRVQRLSPGEWDAAAAQEPDDHHRGFLIVDGLLSREVEVLGRRCVELSGHGDVMRPWRWDEEGSHVRAEVGLAGARADAAWRCSTTGSSCASSRGRSSGWSSSTAAPGARTTSRSRWRSRTTSASRTGCC